MKNNILVILALFFAVSLNAQTEVKLNPLGILFGDYAIAAEFGVQENFGIEPFIGYFSVKDDLGSDEWKLSSFRVGAMGKYYFNPKLGLDRFHVGPYIRFSNGKWKEEIGGGKSDYTRFSLGIFLGGKWVSEGGFLFEVNAGAGRAFVNNVDGEDVSDLALADLDFLLRLVIGYRF